MPPKPPRHQVDPALYADADGVVQVAVPCAFCSYNLQTLRLGSNCPECGKAVGFRFVPELLQNAPVEWLRRVRLGVIFIGAWIVVTALTSIATTYFAMRNMFAAMSVGTAPGPGLPVSYPSFRSMILFSMSFGAIAWILLLIGLWKLTSKWHSSAIVDRPLARRTVRVSLLLSIVNWLVMAGAGGLNFEVMVRPSPIMMTLSSISFIILLFLGVGFWRHLSHLFELLVRRRSARLAGALAWTSALLSTLIAVVSVCHWMQPNSQPPPPPYAMPLFAAPPAGGGGTNTPTPQWLYVRNFGSLERVTVLPPGTPIYNPPPVGGSQVLFGLLSLPVCCFSVTYIVGGIILGFMLLSGLSRAIVDSTLTQGRPA